MTLDRRQQLNQAGVAAIPAVTSSAPPPPPAPPFGMTIETITIPRKLAEDLLALLVRKYDDAERGLPPETYWEMADAVTARAFAEAVGADPGLYVGTSQRGCFPHPFLPGTMAEHRRWLRDANRRETDAEVTRRLGRFPYEACQGRADTTLCRKPAGDPIHQTAEMGA